MLILRFLLLFSCLHLTLTGSALASTIITSADGEVDIAHDFYLGAEGLNKNENKSLRFGYFSGEKWARITLSNPEKIVINKLIYFDTLTGNISLYEKNANGTFLEMMRTGSSTPYKIRNVKSIFAAFPISIEANSEKTFYFKIISRHNFNSRVFVGNARSILEKEEQKLSFLDFYAGGILCLVFYNFFIFFFLRDKNYLYYCLFSTSFLLPILTIHGLLDKIFQPISFTFAHYLICFSAMALMFACVFTYHFLEIPKYLKNIAKLIRYSFFISLCLLLIGLTPFEDRYPQIFGQMIDFLLLISNLLFIISSVFLLKKSSTARFYLFSWIVVFASLISWFGMTFGFLPNNFFTQHSLLYANLGQMLTLSLALAYRIHELTLQKLAAEEKALQKERYQRLVRVLSHDIANSLTIINSYSKKLIKPKNLEDNLQRILEKIYFAAENIKNILNNVREEEMLSVRKIELEKHSVNILEVVETAGVVFEEHLRHKKLKLIINIDRDHHIWANRTCFLNNIVNNIISNSIKFSFENSAIEISSILEKNKIKIIFKDYGRGIQPELIQEIFFSNSIISSKGTQAEPGHGFGTILLREYVELFNGTLNVESSQHECYNGSPGTVIILNFFISSTNVL